MFSVTRGAQSFETETPHLRTCGPSAAPTLIRVRTPHPENAKSATPGTSVAPHFTHDCHDIQKTKSQSLARVPSVEIIRVDDIDADLRGHGLNFVTLSSQLLDRPRPDMTGATNDHNFHVELPVIFRV
ncbi:hypothetical protein FJ970_29300 [Mesorhizobium sp. B2-1-8]|uniref:hypothetical protein n=1 Tax=Mesorhizobium sp. B2-1-8 TaxID=2589967 RepID=UPI001D102D16|nr:hypothetical protein FJ970_29300 [Mesorhizobium sp. B2-1-8]